MDKTTGGAKPKVGSSTTTTNSTNNTTPRTGGSSSSQIGQFQLRNRSPRREMASRSYQPTSSTPRASVRSLRSTRVSNVASLSPSRRASVPNSVARGRNSGASNRTGTLFQGDTSPSLRPSWDQQASGGTSSFSRPVLHRNTRPAGDPASLSPQSDEAGIEDLRSPLRPLLPSLPLPPLPRSSASFQHLLNTASDDSDSDPYSPDSLSERSGSFPLSMASSVTPMEQLSPPGPSRPPSMSRDARVARDLLHDELDDMIQRDEEMARQLQEEMNRESESPSLGMFMPGGLMRSRHFPSIPARHEAGRMRVRGRDRRSENLTFSRGADGSVRMGIPRMLRWVMSNRVPTGRRLADNDPEEDGVSASGPLSPAEEGPPPEHRLLTDSLDPSDDFFGFMNDPSLMLLMFLLRAPDSQYQNDGGVDLEDYESLWDLAERLGEVRHRGISEDQINQIPTLKFKTQNGEAAAVADSAMQQCQICLVDFENGDCLRHIPCKHDFHKDCIDTWLKRNATCPICRQDIKPRA